jgi:hypothetical protein
MTDLQQTLRELHRELADARQLEPSDRALLEAALGDIQRALAQAGSVESEPVAAPGDTLEGAAVRLETAHPALAGALRSLVDALAKAGI